MMMQGGRGEKQNRESKRKKAMDKRKESSKKRTHKKKNHWKLWTKHLTATGTCKLAQLLLASH